MTSTEELLSLLGVVSAEAQEKPARRAEPAPEHIRQMLDAKGFMDAQTGATEKARLSKCHCGMWTWIGLIPNGTSQRLDPRLLTVSGECEAIMAGHLTIGMFRMGDRLTLEYRDPWRIRGHPAGVDTDVLVAHVCGETHLFPTATTCLRLDDAGAIPDEPNF